MYLTGVGHVDQFTERLEHTTRQIEPIRGYFTQVDRYEYQSSVPLEVYNQLGRACKIHAERVGEIWVFEGDRWILTFKFMAGQTVSCRLKRF